MDTRITVGNRWDMFVPVFVDTGVVVRNLPDFLFFFLNPSSSFHNSSTCKTELCLWEGKAFP